MILVDPERRGHGLGTRIFDEVLVRCEAEMRAGRLRCVGLDATPAGHGIYLQRGFVDAGSLVRMRAEPKGSGLGQRGSGLESCPARKSTIQDLTPSRCAASMRRKKAWPSVAVPERSNQVSCRRLLPPVR